MYCPTDKTLLFLFKGIEICFPELFQHSEQCPVGLKYIEKQMRASASDSQVLGCNWKYPETAVSGKQNSELF